MGFAEAQPILRDEARNLAMKNPHTLFEEQLERIPSDVKQFLNKKKAQGEYAKT
jgi:hypothetical protein